MTNQSPEARMVRGVLKEHGLVWIVGQRAVVFHRAEPANVDAEPCV